MRPAWFPPPMDLASAESWAAALSAPPRLPREARGPEGDAAAPDAWGVCGTAQWSDVRATTRPAGLGALRRVLDVKGAGR